MHDKGTICVRIDIPITSIRQTASGVVVLRVQIQKPVQTATNKIAKFSDEKHRSSPFCQSRVCKLHENRKSRPQESEKQRQNSTLTTYSIDKCKATQNHSVQNLMQESVYTTEQTNRIASHSPPMGKFEGRSRERGQQRRSTFPPMNEKRPSAERTGRGGWRKPATAYFFFLSTAVAGLSTSAL